MERADRLAQLFDHQLRLMQRLKVPTRHPGDLRWLQSERPLTIATVTASMALLDEVHEFMRELNWKPWKKKRKEIELDKIHGELVDCWHFLMQLSLMWGLGPDELFEGYLVKNGINHQRQDGGY